ncbi:DNA/RNA non-specific endonuclease [Agathobaculum sp.]|uniref:DNA/RNA non-specific endonuclease n=1 Tax=Agathobaculum sp. TaxID=2048138 RepID=UPI003AB61E24
MRKLTQTLALLVLTLSLLLGGCAQPAPGPSGSQSDSTSTASETAASLDDIPAFSGEPYVVIDDNQPSFTASELTTSSFESYPPLDSLGRCGVAYACISTDLMPADGEKRGSISDVKPSGWVTAKYDFVDGKYLYNRCHLIGWQLTAENANRSNLITGTRYMNVDGMLPFENMVADYIKETGSHVMYRVTPIFDGDDLVAQGVQMEAYSVEDDGDGICFNVFCYNVQPGVTIDYADGTNHLSDRDAQTDSSTAAVDIASAHYVLNTSSKKYHDPSCSAVGKMSEKNRRDFTGTQAELEKEGYTPHTSCIQ